jgi:hypothetical protein
VLEQLVEDNPDLPDLPVAVAQPDPADEPR